MGDLRYKQAKQLFLEVCDLTPDEREKPLTRAGESDPKLRAEVESLLVEHDRAADDKTSFLRLANIPFEMEDDDGKPMLKLVEVNLTNDFQVGTASPGFGTPELAYLPFHGSMVTERTNMNFVYVSLFERRDVDLLVFLREKAVTSD